MSIHDLRECLQKCSFTCARKHGILCLLDHLLNWRFLLQILPAHYTSNRMGSEPSLRTLFEEHGGDAESACALWWHIPSKEFQKGNIFFSIQWFYIFKCLRWVGLTSLRPIQPVKCAIFKLWKQKTWLVFKLQDTAKTIWEKYRKHPKTEKKKKIEFELLNEWNKNDKV